MYVSKTASYSTMIPKVTSPLERVTLTRSPQKYSPAGGASGGSSVRSSASSSSGSHSRLS